MTDAERRKISIVYEPEVFDVPLTSRENSCATKCPSSCHQLPLTNYAAIPPYLRGNRFVLTGYRVNYSAKHCIYSVFQCSNELVNIWSHLLGFLLFAVLYLRDVLSYLPKEGALWNDYAIFTITIAMFGYCMLCSTGFHVFNSHSQRCYSVWLAIDVSGVAVGALGCYLSGVYYGFYCYPFWRTVYAIMVGFMCVSVLGCQVYDALRQTHSTLRSVILFGCLGAMSVVPVTHWVCLENGLSPTVQVFLPKVFIMYSLLVGAMVLYLAKLPERLFPGTFDLAGHSHNLWHLMVLIALCYWHKSALQIVHVMINTKCNNTPS
ncbi:progestin and adipoQ receptor family member 3-like [Convolutriloba macropyga]|uniref:progestin and adipoQ receptor family member 3-like n=1 Tax=Convolutriloba macropyga TaxID=536237 RepID=UPI003F527A7D